MRDETVSAAQPRTGSRAIRGVLFDLDGTLIDSAPDLGAAVNRMRVRRGMAELPYSELRPHASHGARGLVGAGFSLTPDHADFAALRDEFLGHYANALCVDTTIFPEVPALLDALDAAGLPWGIVTNKVSRFTLPLLDALRLSGRTACVVCGDTAARAKPFPDPLLAAAARLGVPAAECVYVGDAERDVQAGIAAGMPTVVARYGYIAASERPDEWPADGHVDSPLALVSWLRSRGAEVL
jgi:phosphoglycolate phosphatase